MTMSKTMHGVSSTASAKLIERLERATGPDPELGRDVLLACGWRRTCAGHFYGPLYYWSSPSNARCYPEDRLPCPTQSIDAALTLLPEGLYWAAGYGRCREAEPLGGVAIYRPGDTTNAIAEAEGSTVAIAVCIAALKARDAEVVEERRERVRDSSST
jgi:hypothetical protein